MSKAIPSDRKSIAKIRRSFKENPELAHLAPYVAGGLKIVHYAFDAIERAQRVKTPRGIELGDICVRVKNPNSAKATMEMAVAVFMIEALKRAVGYEEETCDAQRSGQTGN